MLKLRRLLSLLLFCSYMFVPRALAQSTLTQIQDTVFNVDGSLFNGTLTVSWTGSASSSANGPTPTPTSVKIYNGALSVMLVPSTTSSQGAPYAAVFTSSDGLVTWTETWQVPPASTPLNVSEVTVIGAALPPPGAQITISQVAGLSAEIAAINGSVSSLTTSANSMGSQLTSLSSAVASLTAQLAGLSGGTISSAFADGEVPRGTINGSNAAFTLANTPSPGSTLALFRNGVLLSSGVDYVLTASTITFASGEIPQTGDALQAFYRMAGTSTATLFVDNEVPQGTINGTNLTFTLNSAPQPLLSLRLYKNGDLLQQNVDYTVSGTTITFARVALTPQAGDSLAAFYRTSSH